jgi:hypothetical protein
MELQCWTGVGQGFVVEAQYLGSKSTHVENLFDYNYTRQERDACLSFFPEYDRIAGFQQWRLPPIQCITLVR